MRYKVLLTGTNEPMISDFFFQNAGKFECLTTSSRNEDIVRHIKYFQPDALVFCLMKENANSQKAMFDIKDECSSRNIMVAIIGGKAECEMFKRNSPGMAELVLLRPIEVNQAVRLITEKLNEIKARYGKVETTDPFAGIMQGISETANSAPAIDTDFSIDSMSDLEKVLSGMGLSDLDNSSSDMMDMGINLPQGMELPEQLKQQGFTVNTPSDQRRKHILVVDDDKGILKMLKSILADNYDVATAISGKVAMKFLETKETDLILLDYEMPIQNGPQVLELLRQNPKTKDIPVVFLTGVTESGKIKDVLAMRPQAYLLKPINMERVLSTIKDLIG